MTDHLDRLLSGMSLHRRIAQTCTGLAGAAGAAVVATLWATEPAGLPVRTQAAFAVLIMIGLGWAAWAGWVWSRGPVFALDRVVAGWLGVVACSITAAGTVVIAAARGKIGVTIAGAVVGIALIACAGRVLTRARAHRARLLRQRTELEQPSPTPEEPR
ncbi:hypothetical protein AB0J80_24920 [Actinoplanes sp. NPDC049548]|uniref:hypothetical protein n=1 Tax=Actinoplanes sp. NPDC049548 TaxID=3155152 RepID=UPI00343613E4